MKQKRFIITVAVIAIIFIIIIVAFAGKKQNKNKIPNVDTESIAKAPVEVQTNDKNFEGLEFTDINLKKGEGMTSLTANVKNNTSSETKAQYVKINLLDQNKNVITNITGIVAAMPAGGSTTLSAVTVENCNNASDVEIVSPSKQ